MQALYGYFTTVESLKEASKANLEQIHSLDPAKHDFSDKGLFEERKRLAVQLFSENHSKPKLEASSEVPDEVLENVEKEIQHFQDQIKSEARVRRTAMMRDAEGIFEFYLRFLLLPIEFEHQEKRFLEKKNRQLEGPFIGNPIVEALKEDETLRKQVASKNIGWSSEQEELKNWYRKNVRTSEALEPYFAGEDPNHFVHEVFRKVVFKNENIVQFMETLDLQWSENQPIVKSLVLKTIKGLESGEPFQLGELTKNGKEDFDFFLQLYDGVINENEYLDELIASKTKNWDVDRIALTDRVILKLALVEMMTCRSIPMKVSINEAIEISKQYSTPKSKQFVNGVLDVLSNELTSAGKVRKSGRGLIDNK